MTDPSFEHWKQRVQQEMLYTTYHDSCRDPAVIDGDPRECRRPKGHLGRHASGFGDGYRTWDMIVADHV